MTDMPEEMRLDVFLFRARFFKSRGAAAQAISLSGVRVARHDHVRRVDKPSSLVQPNDKLSFSQHRAVVSLTILSLPLRRGPAPEARSCYELAAPASN